MTLNGEASCLSFDYIHYQGGRARIEAWCNTVTLGEEVVAQCAGCCYCRTKWGRAPECLVDECLVTECLAHEGVVHECLLIECLYNSLPINWMSLNWLPIQLNAYFKNVYISNLWRSWAMMLISRRQGLPLRDTHSASLKAWDCRFSR